MRLHPYLTSESLEGKNPLPQHVFGDLSNVRAVS